MGIGAAERIGRLGIWSGPVECVPLLGGLSNESHVVTDATGRYVVRFGQDYPFHHVFRESEVMAARAAHAAGLAPEVVHAAPGVMVSRYIDARPYGPEDVRRERLRVARLLRQFHSLMPGQVSGPARLFWVFHVIRDYARMLDAAASRYRSGLPGWLALAGALEAAQVPLPVCFAHNDLLPANILDDGARLWLIDFEYAAFSTPMFDLAGVSANAGFTAEEAAELLAAYFDAPPDPALTRAHRAMHCAALLREAMWSMVSALHLTTPGVDFHAYAAENLARLDTALDAYQTAYGKLIP